MAFYRRRYGTIHALARFTGTKLPALWPVVGPVVSRGYRDRWTHQSGVKLLNLGGGSNTIEGALTADLDPRADTYMNLAKRLPFADSSIDYVFTEEFIEHISKGDAAIMLRECARVLKPGGVLRIATPDLDWLSAGLIDGTVPCDLINDTFYGHGHRYLYSRAEMLKAVRAAGFGDVRHSTYKDPGSQLGYLDSHADRFQHDPLLSQYVEAVL
ncbi:class I SAM-dependent methyltransferase [Sphingomonas sp. MMS24-J45]|uniref:class I SAM-dependent methyltransferase n=1 Tax=Sphingomonas sp. MMS24-J45 TaxID=3238806 RepID=UPI00384AD42D